MLYIFGWFNVKDVHMTDLISVLLEPWKTLVHWSRWRFSNSDVLESAKEVEAEHLNIMKANTALKREFL
jgi:hypothetical protein